MLKLEKFTFNPFMENTYVIYDESKECAIIDPGCSNEKERDILDQFIRSRGLKPTAFLNTHCHIDHVFGNAWVARKYNLPLQMHKKDLQTLLDTVQYGVGFGISVEKSPDPEIFLEEGDEVKFGNTRLKVVFTPGHSPGSICFIHDESKNIIAGDVLFQMSIGRTDLPGGDHEVLLDSIRKKLFVLAADYQVHPGHGPATSIGFERDHNPFLKEANWS